MLSILTLKVVCAVVAFIVVIVQLFMEDTKEVKQKSALKKSLVILLVLTLVTTIILSVSEKKRDDVNDENLKKEFSKLQKTNDKNVEENMRLSQELKLLKDKIAPFSELALKQYPHLSQDSALGNLSKFLLDQRQLAFNKMVHELAVELIPPEFLKEYGDSIVYNESLVHTYGDVNRDGVEDIVINFTVEHFYMGNNWQQYIGIFIFKDGQYELQFSNMIGGKAYRVLDSPPIIYGNTIVYAGFEWQSDDPFNFPTLPIRVSYFERNGRWQERKEYTYIDQFKRTRTREDRERVLKELGIYPYE